MNTLDKILFYIDGVLNIDRWERHLLSQNLPLEDEYGICFDEDAIRNLSTIIEITNAKIVIHSTWKIGRPLTWMQSLWQKRELPGQIYDITPDIPPHYDKAIEIASWLEKHPLVKKYVILDDENIFSQYNTASLIQIDSTIGITEKNSKEINAKFQESSL
ncbi:MAG: HAD domain-containing protein [bacterium]|jgi:hypothetical protein|nr:HAD domain-containing protein [bacterium]